MNDIENKNYVEASEDVFTIIRDLKSTQVQIKELQDRKRCLTDTLYSITGGEGVITHEGKKIGAWINVSPYPKFDKDRFKSECPDLYSSYTIMSNGNNYFRVS